VGSSTCSARAQGTLIGRSPRSGCRTWHRSWPMRAAFSGALPTLSIGRFADLFHGDREPLAVVGLYDVHAHVAAALRCCKRACDEIDATRVGDAGEARVCPHPPPGHGIPAPTHASSAAHELGIRERGVARPRKRTRSAEEEDLVDGAGWLARKWRSPIRVQGAGRSWRQGRREPCAAA